MSDEIQRLLVRVEASAVQLEAEMKRINRSLHGTQAETRKTLDQIKRDFKSAGRDLGNDFYRPVQAASALALGAIITFSINAARRAEAVDGAFDQTFRAMPDKAQGAVTAISKKFVRLETDLKDRFTQMQSVLVALGVNAEKSLQIVDALTQRSLDIAAFKDVDDAQAFQAVISGITGETEPLKKFGIVVNETAVKAELLRLGFKGNATNASDAAKAIARTNIILSRSKEMQGQVAREAETLSEQQKRANMTFTETAEVFGKQFLPIAKEVLLWAGDTLEAFNDLPDGVQNASLAMLAMVAAGGPIVSVVKGLRSIIAAATAAKAALAGVGAGAGGAAAGAGAAGGAAAASRAGLGAFGSGAVALTLPLLTSGDTQQKALSGQERINEQLAEEARLTGVIARLRNSGQEAEARRQEQYKARIAEDRQYYQQMQAGVALATQVGQDLAAANALETVSDFGLSELEQKPVAGSDNKNKGPTAEQLRQRTLDREDRTNRALSSADDDLLRAREAMAVEAEDRLALELEAIDRERKARNKDLDLAVQQSDLEQAQVDRIKAAEEAARQQYELNARADAAEAVQNERLDIARDLAAFERDMLDLQERLAETPEARLEVQRDILTANQAERRAALENALLERGLTKAKRAAIEALLARLPEMEAGERSAFESDASRGVQTARGFVAENRERDSLASDQEAALEEIRRLEEEGVIAHEEAMKARADIDQHYWSARLTGEGSMLDLIAGLQNSSIEELAILGKSAAIAQATIDGILAVQNAWAHVPFPANIAAAAFVAAQTAANVAAISGMADGGAVKGPGGPREDKIPVMLSNGEYVINARAAAALGRIRLDQMNSTGRLPRFADGGLVSSSLMRDVNALSPASAPASRTSTSLTFAPIIDARGADSAAVARLRAIMEAERRNFAKNVRGVMQTREKYRLGRNAEA